MGSHEFSQRLVAIFLFGCLLFGYPLLAAFNVPALVGGVPVLYLYLFGAWLVVILLAGHVAERAPPPAQETPQDPRV